MQIQDGSTVEIHYTLVVENEVVDSSAGKEPLKYVQGSGEIIPGLEEELTGLAAGDKKEVLVEPEKGYGPSDPEAVRQLPRDAFQNPETLEVGALVGGTVKGQQFQARIASIDDESVTIDLNHPLAGKTLNFAVEVVHVS